MLHTTKLQKKKIDPRLLIEANVLEFLFSEYFRNY